MEYELILSSGGMKGCMIVGALEELNKRVPLHNFKYFNLNEINQNFFFRVLNNSNYTVTGERKENTPGTLHGPSYTLRVFI